MLRSITRLPENLGRKFLHFVSDFGEAWIFILQVLFRCCTPPIYWKEIFRQTYSIGVQSIGVVTLVGGFTGAVLAVQGEYSLSKFGAEGFTGSMIALSLIRELGPVLTALMVNGRAGSAVTAEIGIMKITEQIDALRSMAVDPLRHLIAPRVIAGIISVPLLTAMFNVMGILGGYIVGIGNLGLSSGIFISQMVQAVGDVDVISGFIKSVVFGFCVFWIACFKGWHCGFGARGVNVATTSAVVTSSVVVLVIDYFLTSILTNFFL